MKEGRRDSSCYSRGEGLIPLEPIDVRNIDSFSDMLRAMAKTSFGGRRVGEAANVLCTMVSDKNCFRILTLSGAMTVAQQNLVIDDLIDLGWFDCVVSTGALIAHGAIEGIHGVHYRADSGTDDRKFYHMGANRIYDTLELEYNMDLLEAFVGKVFVKAAERPDPWSSWEICRRLGKYLHNHSLSADDRVVLRTAYMRNIPIFIPAFTDSELGLDFCIQIYAQRLAGLPTFNFNSFLDLEKYTEMVANAVRTGKNLGIFIIGGGVPRNWAQQVGPHLDIRGMRLGQEHGAFARFKYAVRFCTAPESDGGLSGSTFREGVSWGKHIPREEGGMQAEAVVDATIVLPMVVRGVMERLGVI